MIAALWLGTYVIHSTALCGAALLFRRGLRRVRGAEWVWRAAVLLPAISATTVQLSGAGLWTIGIETARDLSTQSAAGSLDVPLANGIDIPWIIAAVWLLVGVTLVVRDWGAHRTFVRRLGTRRSADATLVAAVSDLLRHPRARRPIRLTYSASLASPIALGRSEICLPVRAIRDLNSRQLRALVAHEVAHIVRRDERWFAALACVESVLFVQPLTRIANREVHYLAETACDQWAARELSDPTAMAHCLVEVAGWSRTARPATVLGVAGMSGLTDRVTRLLDPPHAPRQVSRAFGVAAVAGLSAATACLTVSLTSTARAAVVATAPQSRALPLELGARSDEFIRGFEAGRRFAGRPPSAERPAVMDRRRVVSSSGHDWRAQIERELQARTPGGASR